ncbi:HDIG domain-containing protein [Flavobacteriaceae bacterium]|jgi:cyclic-di-AMP phosphodiesterase PgpH|nr:HDIG domain-containing protein [Flavobacteriaceae bacterium]
MIKYLNKLYKNYNFIYKVILLFLSVYLIVSMFPKSGKFKYSFENGKPWQSENLYAPFNFAVLKNSFDLERELDDIKIKTPVYFDQITNLITSDSLTKSSIDYLFQDTITSLAEDSIVNSVNFIAKSIYKKGFADSNYDYDSEQKISLVSNNIIVSNLIFSDILLPKDLSTYINNLVIENNFSVNENRIKSILFEIIQPNITFNKGLSENAYNESISKVSNYRGMIDKQTLIISKGEVVDKEKLIILKSLEKEYENENWSTENYYLIILSYSILVSLGLIMILLFLNKYKKELYLNNNKLTFIYFNIVLMIGLTTLVVKLNSLYVYVIPICILPLILKAFFDSRTSFFVHTVTILLIGFIVPNNFEYIFLNIIAGIVTILSVSDLYKRANLFIAVAQITAIYILAYFSFFVIHEGGIEFIKFENFVLFILCGLGTLFVHPLIYIYEKVFGLVSDVSLLELSDTNSELLKLLSDKSPGTFNHSLSVANLAEAAANEVGANSLLARVGALYHDIGKMNNPSYFSENQLTGVNPHDELNSKESVRIILDHVIQGIEIARKYNIPERVIDFIRTHHGTSLVYYFYNKDLKLEIKPDEKDYMYGGPKPFSKETAIVMMCDGVEAASKSLKNPDFVKINEFVNLIISKQINSDQFINANITFKEIEVIKKVLINKLINIFHIRIEYPQ